MRTRVAIVPNALAAAALALAGCGSSYQLRMKPTLDPNDETVTTPILSSHRYGKVMVIPPSGTARAQFDTEINLFEREFLKNGITVISGAITGRVVLEAPGEGAEKKGEAARDLSDAERALIMAKKTGADAILQIGQFGWSSEEARSRYFILDESKGRNYQEVVQSDYMDWKGKKYTFSSPVLTFIGRLMDVETGQVIASFKTTCAANWTLPDEYVARIEFEEEAPIVVHENYNYHGGGWLTEAKEKTVSRVIQLVAKRIVGQ